MKSIICILLLACPLFADFNSAVLQDGLYPNAAISSQGDIFVTAINWSIPYVGVAEKFSQNGEKLWSNAPQGLYLTNSIAPAEYALLSTPKIICENDGGAFFLYDYGM